MVPATRGPGKIDHFPGTQACLSCPRHKGTGYRRAVSGSKRIGVHTVPVAIRGRRVAAGCALAALLAVVLGATAALFLPGSSSSRSAVPPPSRVVEGVLLQAMTPCERLATGRQRRLEVPLGSGRRILVLGDSWSTGARLEPGVAAWPARLDGEVHVDGVPGSGFSRGALECPGLSYGDRVAEALRRANPDLVIVQGGLNDTDQSQRAVRRGFLRLAILLAGRDVVVVGPALAPARADRVPAVDELLAELSDAAGFRYVSTTDLELDYHRDGVHLVRAGHRTFGAAVVERVLDAG